MRLVEPARLWGSKYEKEWSKWDHQVVKSSQGHISQVSDSKKWNSRIYLWFKLLMSDRSWYWMLSDEGRVGVCKFTSSVVSPLALSLPLFDSSALPQTWPRTLLYSLFPLFPTLRLLSSHIRHNSFYSSLTKSVPLFPLYIANDAWIGESFLLWLIKYAHFLHIYSQYLFHIITHVPIINTALTFQGQVGLIIMIILS